jgi:UDP-N-acetylglucosamine transferase subunit ALG13
VIFVTVGHTSQSFRRLLTAVDELAGGGFFADDTVFAQTGYTPVKLHHCEAKPFLGRDEFREKMERANLIISHGGATIFEVVRMRRMPVVMPRRKKYGEHVNDHQAQFVRALASEGWIAAAFEPDELPGAIEKARTSRPTTEGLPTLLMLPLVARAIEELGSLRSCASRS